MEVKIDWLSIDKIPKGLYKPFIEMFSISNVNEIIANVNTEVKIIQVNNDICFPITKNDRELMNSFVCSPYTAYVLYAKDELDRKISNILVNTLVTVVIKFVDFWLRKGNIDRNVHVNNFLLSTNPYPEWDGKEIQDITDLLVNTYPTHAIIFRSFNDYQHQHLFKEFEENGYQKIASRQVYIFDLEYQRWLQHKNNKHDRRIIKKRKLNYVSHDDMYRYLDQALNLYNQLYLLKYSKYNPQFTLNFFQICHQKKIMHFQGYIDMNEKLKAFAGVFVVDKTITSPLVGYDTNAPQKEGLYIHAIELIMQYKFKNNLLLNLSSGAPKFKRLRGGKPSVEYAFVYSKHLSFNRRLTWAILQFISNKIGLPLIKKYEL